MATSRARPRVRAPGTVQESFGSTVTARGALSCLGQQGCRSNLGCAKPSAREDTRVKPPFQKAQ
eukprot:3490798-Pyramimonas_sp.AAC.4